MSDTLSSLGFLIRPSQVFFRFRRGFLLGQDQRSRRSDVSSCSTAIGLPACSVTPIDSSRCFSPFLVEDSGASGSDDCCGVVGSFSSIPCCEPHPGLVVPGFLRVRDIDPCDKGHCTSSLLVVGGGGSDPGCSFSVPVPLVLTTDACLWGWGATLGGLERIAPWSLLQRTYSSNWRELQAVLMALLAFAPQLEGSTVLVRTDDMVARCYLNRHGWTRCKALNLIAHHFFSWAEAHLFSLGAVTFRAASTCGRTV